jgi:hypothetical protein
LTKIPLQRLHPSPDSETINRRIDPKKLTLQISPNARACRSLSSTYKLERFDAYLRYTKQAAANRREPRTVLIAPILLLQIEITGFFIPFMAQLVYASPSNTRPLEVRKQIQKQARAAKPQFCQDKN